MKLMLEDGTAALPSQTLNSDPDSGWYSAGVAKLNATIAGSEVFEIEATRVDFNEGTLNFITLPVKTTTGDPSSPQDGDTYVNIFDNKIRTWADSAWRDLATW